jgi:hypothetical protein
MCTHVRVIGGMRLGCWRGHYSRCLLIMNGTLPALSSKRAMRMVSLSFPTSTCNVSKQSKQGDKGHEISLVLSRCTNTAMRVHRHYSCKAKRHDESSMATNTLRAVSSCAVSFAQPTCQPNPTMASAQRDG